MVVALSSLHMPGVLLLAGLVCACQVEEIDDDRYPNIPDDVGSVCQAATPCPNGGNVEPVVSAFGPAIDAYAAYDGQKTCDPTPKPGTVGFRDLVLATYPCTGSSGISRDCSVGGTSEHKEGRAWDWTIAYPHPAADALLAWLLSTDKHGNPNAMVRRFGLMYMIWNSQIWKSYQAGSGWQTYTGANPHTDHVHFSFSWAGALKQASYWTSPLPADTGPPPLPDKGAFPPDEGVPPPPVGDAESPKLDGSSPPPPPAGDGVTLPPPTPPGGATPGGVLRGGCQLASDGAGRGTLPWLALLLAGLTAASRRARRGGGPRRPSAP